MYITYRYLVFVQIRIHYNLRFFLFFVWYKIEGIYASHKSLFQHHTSSSKKSDPFQASRQMSRSFIRTRCSKKFYSRAWNAVSERWLVGCDILLVDFWCLDGNFWGDEGYSNEFCSVMYDIRLVCIYLESCWYCMLATG